MLKALEESVASSSAHGISRAAGAKNSMLKLMWILLFLLFLMLFLKSGISLVVKLKANKLTKVYHLDHVPFVFPDLYFCPSNPYSGSFPYVLTKAEAEQLNSAISNILNRYEQLYNDSDANMGALYVQTSLPFYLTVEHLALRVNQSVLKAELSSNYMSLKVDLEPFYEPENLVCFKALLTDSMKQKMLTAGSQIEIWLSTDPYFSDFNYTGHPIRPIKDKKNRTVSFLSWHPTRIIEDLKVSGYTMLIVPPGAYPSLRFENKFHLAPGNAYSVKLQMEENVCSEELHKTHCVGSFPVKFTNPLTGQPDLFNYSSAACYYHRRNHRLTSLFGCQNSIFPMPWHYRSWPRCLNVSETNASVVAKLISEFTNPTELEVDASDYCKIRIPCSYPHYSASHSFGKWPSAGSATDHFFANEVTFNESVAPALARLANLSRQLQSDNSQLHLKELFRSYLSESMVSVSISAASVMASQVVLTGSYSFTDFLADIGGLLGLYIGCSMLTLCELLEVAYILLKQVFTRRRASPSRAAAPNAAPLVAVAEAAEGCGAPVGCPEDANP